MAISKVNKTYATKEKLTSAGMNNITGKVDELVEAANTQASTTSDLAAKIGEIYTPITQFDLAFDFTNGMMRVGKGSNIKYYALIETSGTGFVKTLPNVASSYKLTYLDTDGTTQLYQDTYAPNASVTMRAVPTRTGYTNGKWTPTYTQLSDDYTTKLSYDVDMSVGGAIVESDTTEQNTLYTKVLVDSDSRIIYGLKQDGSVLDARENGLNGDAHVCNTMVTYNVLINAFNQ